MSLFVLNLVLAIGWCALNGSFDGLSFVGGFLFGLGALYAVKPLYGDTPYFRRVYQLVRLVVHFLYELVVSSFRVFWDVITPNLKSRPGVVVVPTRCETDVEITMLANLISLTPGTLTLDVSRDRKNLFVHAMYLDDPDALRAEIRDGMEERVLEAVR